jgi:hypothetical protein
MPKSKRARKKKLITFKAKSMSIGFHHVSFTQEQFSKLSIEQRYCVLLLGHIQHEISWLQRLMYITGRSGRNHTDLENAGQTMQGAIVLRLLLGKLNEFRTKVEETKIIRTFLQDWCDPDEPREGAERITRLLALFSSNPWLQSARNRHFLHYPTLGNVRDTLEDENMQWDFEMFAADSTMNSIYPTADVMANLAWCRLVNPEDSLQGLNQAYGSMTELSGEVIQILELAIGHFVDRNLGSVLAGNKISLEVQTDVQDIRLPFFMSVKKNS